MEEIKSPFIDFMGMTFLERENRSSRVRLTIRSEHLNSHGVLHGGVSYSLADTGMGGALYTVLEDGERCATIENQIMYLAPVSAGEIICTSHVIHKGRRLARIQSELENDGRLFAKATGTFAIFKL